MTDRDKHLILAGFAWGFNTSKEMTDNAGAFAAEVLGLPPEAVNKTVACLNSLVGLHYAFITDLGEDIREAKED